MTTAWRVTDVEAVQGDEGEHRGETVRVEYAGGATQGGYTRLSKHSKHLWSCSFFRPKGGADRREVRRPKGVAQRPLGRWFKPPEAGRPSKAKGRP